MDADLDMFLSKVNFCGHHNYSFKCLLTDEIGYVTKCFKTIRTAKDMNIT